jgi:hypothetical protein
LVAEVRVGFLATLMAVLVQIQFFPLSPLLAGAVVELKTTTVLLVAQVAVVVEIQLLVVAELPIKALLAGLAHLVNQ